MHKVHIIGIGDDGLDGLTAAARRLVEEAEVLVGTERTLSIVSPNHAMRVHVGNDFAALVQELETFADKRAVVLATGDPLFYGVARYLCERMGKDRFEVIPHVSSMQLAFARVKESWDEAYLANLASVPLERAVERIRTAEKAGLFTTEDCPPSRVAEALLDRKIDYFSAYVCENLGSPDERVTQGRLADLVDQQFGPLNVLILTRLPGVPDRPMEMVGRRLFGNPDEQFLQSQPKRGLLTGMEVRAIALADLDLGPRSIVWDIGAGSGSVAVEAAQLAREGTVYAIEMDPSDHELIAANAERFGVTNLVPILGRAPDAWNDLPEPDAIFIGGSGRTVRKIVEQALERLRPGGRLVANVGSVQNVADVFETLAPQCPDLHVRMVNISHGTPQLESLRFESLNPTFLISLVKG